MNRDEEKGRNELEIRKQANQALIAVAVTLVLSIAGYSFSRFDRETACFFASSHIFAALWPFNFRDAYILESFGYNSFDICTLVFTRSIMSGTLLAYMIYIFVSQIWVRETYYTQNFIPFFACLVVLGLFACFKPVSLKLEWYGLSVYSDVEANLRKSFIRISLLYILTALLIGRIFSYIRLKAQFYRQTALWRIAAKTSDRNKKSAGE